MNDRAWIATRKGLFTVTRRAGEWGIAQSHFVGDNVPMMFFDPRDGAVYAALFHGHFGTKLHRSDDGGATWAEIATPKYPEQPADDPPDLDGFGKPVPWSLKIIWSLEAGSLPGELWCGTIPGALFRSTDRGDSWSIVRSLWDHPSRKRWMGGGADHPGIHSICLHPTEPDTLHVGVSCGGVWKTRDHGASWTIASQGMRADFLPPGKQYDPISQDPHRVVQCPSKPDVLWTQHHNGIFRTENSGDKWEEVLSDRPGQSGFAVVVHPADADRAWFIPMTKDEKRYPPDGKLVALRTGDGGKSFEVLRRGLPQENAYDLVFRHAMDIDSTGDRLLFGSTTGNVFVSEDGGDGWHQLAGHLPPVYAVRFG